MNISTTLSILVILVCICAINVGAQNYFSAEVYDSFDKDPKAQHVYGEVAKMDTFINTLLDKCPPGSVIHGYVTNLISNIVKGRHDQIEVYLKDTLIRHFLCSNSVEISQINDLALRYSTCNNQMWSYVGKYQAWVVESRSREGVFDRELKKLFRAMPLFDGDRILDVGSGNSSLYRLINKKIQGAKIIINDIDSNQLVGQVYHLKFNKDLRKKMTKNQNSIDIIRGDKESTGAEGLVFDKVIMTYSFHHFDEYTAMLSSIKKSIDHNSEVLVVERFTDYGNQHCKSDFSQTEFERRFAEAGFKSKEVKRIRSARSKGPVFLYRFYLDRGN